jgi:hypothetical protein
MESNWGWAAAAVVLIVVVIAVVSSCGSGSQNTVTETVRTKAPQPPHTSSAQVEFQPTSLADGSTGTVTISPAGGSELQLVINLSIPNLSTYGIALWTDQNHWQGLYTGARGSNTQKLVLGAHTLLRYRFLTVGQRIVRARVKGHVLRMGRHSIVTHQLLQISTGELLNRLLATTQ